MPRDNKRLAHAFELADELAEDQRLMFVADEVVDEFEECLELGAGQRCRGIDEAGVATGPAQLGDFGENVNAILAAAALVAQLGERFQRAQTHGFVEGPLVLGQVDFERDFGARRQFREDGALGSPQHERSDQGTQRLKPARVMVALDRRDEAAAKTLARAQQARIDDGEQAPQFVEIIFDRRSRQRNAKMRLEPLSRLSAPSSPRS